MSAPSSASRNGLPIGHGCSTTSRVSASRWAAMPRRRRSTSRRSRSTRARSTRRIRARSSALPASRAAGPVSTRMPEGRGMFETALARAEPLSEGATLWSGRVRLNWARGLLGAGLREEAKRRRAPRAIFLPRCSGQAPRWCRRQTADRGLLSRKLTAAEGQHSVGLSCLVHGVHRLSKNAVARKMRTNTVCGHPLFLLRSRRPWRRRRNPRMGG